jgi:hypothetical protein
MWKFWNNPIKVHCWGGFGSQLYALSVAIDLKSQFAKREIKIIFHTGGITHRKPEIGDLIGTFSYEIINDFKNLNELPSSKTKIRSLLRIFFSLIAVFTGFISRSNSDAEFKKIKPWVQTLRGHYSYRFQSKHTIKEIFTSQQIQLKDNIDVIGVQFRLGDLTALENKPPIDANRIATLINQINGPSFSVNVYSDSPSKAISRLSSSGIHGIPTDRNSLETVLDLFQAQYFIGTSSKISFWIIILRSFFGSPDNSYMPISNMEQLKFNIGEDKVASIAFY